jgi:hypothetical protein
MYEYEVDEHVQSFLIGFLTCWMLCTLNPSQLMDPKHCVVWFQPDSQIASVRLSKAIYPHTIRSMHLASTIHCFRGCQMTRSLSVRSTLQVPRISIGTWIPAPLSETIGLAHTSIHLYTILWTLTEGYTGAWCWPRFQIPWHSTVAVLGNDGFSVIPC